MEIWREIAADAASGARRLVTEYGDRLYTAAFRICQNESDAEDLVFRTFAEVVRKISQYRGDAAFFSYLYQIMLNFWRMDARRKGANSLAFGEETPDVPDPAPDPAEALAARSDGEAVRTAIALLPEPLRAVVVLRYFEDMSMAEMARLLSLPVGTVKFRLFRAKRLLAGMLAQTFCPFTAPYLLTQTNERKRKTPDSL